MGGRVVELLAERSGERLRAEKGTRSLLAQLRWPNGLSVVAFPQTYMNDSGLAVVALVRRYGIDDLRRLVVVHDELDLPTGRIKVKLGGGTAGNNGLKSIHAHLHDDGYARIRIGIGKPPGRQAGADYVLRRPGKTELETLEVAIAMAADAVETLAAEGLDAAMNRFNVAP